MSGSTVLTVLLLINLCTSSLAIQCLDQSGEPVDWFIIYKIPLLPHSKVPDFRHGTGFYYMDKYNPHLQLSSKPMTDKGHAVRYTLDQIYKNQTTVGYAMYNDETPEGKMNNGRGHTKGVMALDKKGGFWMVHSTPKFPPHYKDGYSWDATKNGQTFLCISLSYGNMDGIGTVFEYIYPHFYDKYFPDVFAADNPTLAKIVQATSRRQGHVSSLPWYRITKLQTMGNDMFWSFGKFTRFERDLYDSLVAPELKTDILVQSWIMSKKSPDDTLRSNCTTQYKVLNILETKFPDGRATFQTAKDHSKWAVSDQGSWLCIGDINRQKPQFHRSGGQVCFQNVKAHNSFRQLVSKTDQC